MDPCPFVRVFIGNLALKFPVSSSKPSLSRIHPSLTPCFCKINLKTLQDQVATIPLLHHQLDRDQSHAHAHESFSASNPVSLAACFTLNKTQIDKFVQKQLVSSKHPVLSIDVYSAPDGASCGIPSGKSLGKVYVPLDLRGTESRASVVHNGWVALGASKKGSSAQLHLTVKVEPDPRFVFQFGGEPECSPQVFQVQGSAKQAVFTCKFGFRNAGDRNLRSSLSMSEPSTSRSWLTSVTTDKDQTSKERKGWSITIHALSGSPVAMASMVTPFVPSPGSDRVSRSNPGAWLILRPGDCTWKPWGRLEAWREPGRTDALGYRFELFHDLVLTSSTTMAVANSTISARNGGKFTIDTTNNINTTPTPLTSPHGSFDFGSGSVSGSVSGSRPGSGSGSDFWFLPQAVRRGFVMSSTVEGVGKCSKPEVEVGVQHVTCTEDAAAFVALAAAMDLSMDACRLFSQRLRKELRQQSQQFVV